MNRKKKTRTKQYDPFYQSNGTNIYSIVSSVLSGQWYEGMIYKESTDIFIFCFQVPRIHQLLPDTYHLKFVSFPGQIIIPNNVLQMLIMRIHCQRPSTPKLEHHIIQCQTTLTWVAFRSLGPFLTISKNIKLCI